MLLNVFILKKLLGIKFKHTVKCPELNGAKFCPEITLDEKLPTFPVDINQPKLIVFVDDAYPKDNRK